MSACAHVSSQAHVSGVSLCLHMHMSVVSVHVRCQSECARVSSVHVSVYVCAHVGSQCTCQVSVCVCQ